MLLLMAGKDIGRDGGGGGGTNVAHKSACARERRDVEHVSVSAGGWPRRVRGSRRSQLFLTLVTIEVESPVAPS